MTGAAARPLSCKASVLSLPLAHPAPLLSKGTLTSEHLWCLQGLSVPLSESKLGGESSRSQEMPWQEKLQNVRNDHEPLHFQDTALNCYQGPGKNVTFIFQSSFSLQLEGFSLEIVLIGTSE